MAGEFEKLFGPKVTKDKPKWPSGVGVGLEFAHSLASVGKEDANRRTFAVRDLRAASVADADCLLCHSASLGLPLFLPLREA